MPAAGCAAVREMVTAPPRPARVMGAFQSAVYLEVPDAEPGGVLAVVAADAVRLPNSLALGVPAADRPFAQVRPGEAGVVGYGVVTLGALDIEARRWWRPAVTGPAADLAHLQHGLRRLAAELAGDRADPDGGIGGALDPSWRPALLPVATEELIQAATALDLAAAFAAAHRMVGLGPGLTPSGDDVLCGFLVTVSQLARPAALELRALAGALGALVVARAARATTALSATLLGHAARGEAAAEVIDLLAAVAAGAPGPALARLLAVGHWSGYDLATGVAAGGRVVAHTLAPAPGAPGRCGHP